jgi:hypothetical protein
MLIWSLFSGFMALNVGADAHFVSSVKELYGPGTKGAPFVSLMWVEVFHCLRSSSSSSYPLSLSCFCENAV